MKQRTLAEWRYLAFAALALSLAVGLFITFAARAEGPSPQQRVLQPVRQAPEPAPDSKPTPAGGWQILDPVRYENLSIFPVIATQDPMSGNATAGFLTLDEGLASGEVVVTERGGDFIRRSRGSAAPVGTAVMTTFPEQQRAQTPQGGAAVNTLVLINRSKRPLLLLAGEVVSGGKQDRVIGKDRIVPAGADPLPLDVFCVEHGRWSAGNEFKAANMMVHPSVREQAAVAKDQSKVWGAVRSGSTSDQAARARASGVAAAAPAMSAEVVADVIATEANSQSYDKVYNSRTVRASVDSFAAEVNRRFQEATKGRPVVGVVVAYGAEVAWSDVFASDTLFARYWPKLLRSYVVEAVARPQLREQATVADAQRFFAPLEGHEQIETEPGVYRWREITEGRQAQIELESLLGKPFTLHRVKVQRTS